jgi:hypothetical protein
MAVKLKLLEKMPEIAIGLIPNEDAGALELIAVNEKTEEVALIGYICCEGCLHLVPDELLGEWGLNVNEDGYINVNYDGFEDEDDGDGGDENNNGDGGLN